MTDIEKIKKFITKKHSINCALTDEIMEFIAKVESESKEDVTKPLLADLRVFIKNQLENLEYFEAKSDLTEYGIGYKDALKKVSEHFG